MNKVVYVDGVELHIGLDRFVIGLPYPKLPNLDIANPVTNDVVVQINISQKEFVSCLKHLENTIKDTGKYVIGKCRNKDLKRYKVLSEQDGGLLCFYTLGFCFGTGVINIEVNPSKLTADKWGELLALISIQFYHQYEELYARGVVSHAEFYVDVVGESISNLVLIDEGRRATTHFKGTTYQGKRGSPLVGTMYDKASELKLNEKLIRIETRMNRNDIAFKDLIENDLFNPFSKFLVLNVNKLQLIANEFGSPSIKQNIVESGLFKGIKNKHARKAILALLKENAISWWKPELFWSTHKTLLLNFMPSNVGKIV